MSTELFFSTMSQHVFPTNLNEIGTTIFPHNELIRRGDPNYYHYSPADPLFGDKFVDSKSLSPSAAPRVEIKRSPGAGYSPLGDSPSTRVTKVHDTSSPSRNSVNNSFDAVSSPERQQRIHESPKQSVQRPSDLNVANAIEEYVQHHERLQHLDDAVDVTPSPMVESGHQHQVVELIREAELREHDDVDHEQPKLHEHHDQHSVEHHAQHHAEKLFDDQQQHQSHDQHSVENHVGDDQHSYRHEYRLPEEHVIDFVLKPEAEPAREHIYDNVPEEDGYEIVPNVVDEKFAEESVRERVEEYEHRKRDDVQQQEEHHQQHSTDDRVHEELVTIDRHHQQQREQLEDQTDPIDSIVESRLPKPILSEQIVKVNHPEESRETVGEFMVQTLVHQSEHEQVQLHEQHSHSDQHTTVHHVEHHQQKQEQQQQVVQHQPIQQVNVQHQDQHQMQQLQQLDQRQQQRQQDDGDDNAAIHDPTRNTVKQMVNSHERRHQDEHTADHHAAHHKAKLAALVQQQQQQPMKEDPTLTVSHDRHEVRLEIVVKDSRSDVNNDNEVERNNAMHVQFRPSQTSPIANIEQQYPLVDSPTKVKTDAIIAQLKSVGVDAGGMKTLKDLKEEKRLSYQRKEEDITAEIARVRREYTAEKFLNETPTHGGKSGFELPEWKRKQIAQKKAEEAAKLEEARIVKEFEEWKLSQRPGWVKQRKSD